MDVGVVEIQAYQPIFDTGRVVVLLACITFYGILSMANFAVLAIAVVKQTSRAFRACGVLAAVNYLAGLAALPLLGDFVGLSQAAEVVGLMYLELAILATIAGHRCNQSRPCVALGELGELPVARALAGIPPADSPPSSVRICSRPQQRWSESDASSSLL